MQVGTVCILPPPPPVAPLPVLPAPVIQVVAPQPPRVLVGPGQPCMVANQCVSGAFCNVGACACRSAYAPFGSICVRKSKTHIQYRLHYWHKSPENPRWSTDGLNLTVESGTVKSRV